MTPRDSHIAANLAHFEAKLAAERQLMDVVRKVRGEGGDFLLLDVRSPEGFAAGHLPGAWSLPLEEVEAHLAELPRERELVLYCWRSTCHLAARAGVILSRAGFLVREMNAGWREWAGENFPIHAGEARGLRCDCSEEA